MIIPIITIYFTCDFHFLFYVLGSVNLHQKVQHFIGFFPRQRNLIGTSFFEFGFEHGPEHW